MSKKGDRRESHGASLRDRALLAEQLWQSIGLELETAGTQGAIETAKRRDLEMTSGQVEGLSQDALMGPRAAQSDPTDLPPGSESRDHRSGSNRIRPVEAVNVPVGTS